MNQSTIKRGLIVAGLINVVGVLLFSKVFTNEVLQNADPIVMSNFGLLIIIIWGFAYLAVSNKIKYLPLLAIVFAIEKFVYAVHWLTWITNNLNDLHKIFDQDFLAGTFYLTYGVNDFVFMIFFLWIFFKIKKSNSKSSD